MPIPRNTPDFIKRAHELYPGEFLALSDHTRPSPDAETERQPTQVRVLAHHQDEQECSKLAEAEEAKLPEHVGKGFRVIGPKESNDGDK